MMDTAPTADLVYQGICTMFHNTNLAEQEKASKWLEEFQKSICSWTIADELLQQKRDLYSCCFAAQTMRHKIQTSFNELPMNSHEALRNTLMAHVGQITYETDAVIVTKLCLAVADLALLMSSWKQPIDDLLAMHSSQLQSVWPLLEILTLIPEEIDSRYLRLGANRRQEIYKQLDAAAPKVIELLYMCVQHGELSQEKIIISTFRCYSSWVSIEAISIQQSIKNPLTQQVVNLLSLENCSRKLHDTCTECLCTILSCIEANAEIDNLDPQLKFQIFNSVRMLEAQYYTSVVFKDMNKIMNYCRIFTALCETFFKEMFANGAVPHYSIKSLDLVLMCTDHYDYEVAENTFDLWNRLVEELFERENYTLMQHFEYHIERLLRALYRLAQMKPDHKGLIEENHSFNDFRRKIADLIKNVAFIFDYRNCFKQMFYKLQEPVCTWESTESALFIMQNLAKNIVPDENQVIPHVLEAILNLPENIHIAVRYTSIMLLGELGVWIENHAECLEAVLNFLLYALQQKNGLAAAAAQSLTSICTSTCGDKMVYHISGLVEISRNLDNFEINNDLAIDLLKGISSILSRLPRHQLETAMREIIACQLQPLALMVENNDGNVTICKGERSDPVYWVDRACAVIRYTKPDVPDTELHPTLQILSDAWPLISHLMHKYQTDGRVMESICRLIVHGVRMVRKQAYMLVEPLIHHIVTLYALHHHSCFLYLGSILVDEFAKVEECISGLLGMLKAFIEPTFQVLQVENGLINNPDMVDDFFWLCSNFIVYCPLPFLQSSLVTPIFKCALLACTLDHREANSSVMNFFSRLLRLGHINIRKLNECKSLVKDIAAQNGEALVANLVYASVFCLYSYMQPDVAKVLSELKGVVTPEQMEAFLKSALQAFPKKNNGGHVMATDMQLDDLKEAILKSTSQEFVRIALKGLTRLFR